jgi:hypothetical protein
MAYKAIYWDGGFYATTGATIGMGSAGGKKPPCTTTVISCDIKVVG